MTSSGTGAEALNDAITEASSAQLMVLEKGFTQLPAGDFGGPTVTYAVVFGNNGTAIATKARVQLTFTGADGAVKSSQDEYLAAVLPGAKAALGDTLYDVDGVTAMSVQLLPGDSEKVEKAPADFAVSQVNTVAQEFGGLKTTATVSSPFAKDLQDLLVTAVYRGADGAVIGGGFTYLSFVPAKGSAGVELTSSADGIAPASTDVLVQLSTLSLLD